MSTIAKGQKSVLVSDFLVATHHPIGQEARVSVTFGTTLTNPIVVATLAEVTIRALNYTLIVHNVNSTGFALIVRTDNLDKLNSKDTGMLLVNWIAVGD